MPRPTQRSILEVLTKARLVEAAAGFEVDVAQSRPKAGFVEVSVASKKQPLGKQSGVLTPLTAVWASVPHVMPGFDRVKLGCQLSYRG